MIWSLQNRQLRLVLTLLLDFLAITFVLALGDIYNYFNFDPVFELCVILSWMLSIFLSAIFHPPIEESPKQVFFNVLRVLAVFLMLFAIIVFFLNRTGNASIVPPANEVMLLTGFNILLYFLVRFAIRLLFRYFEYFHFENRRVIILGTGETARRLYGFFESKENYIYTFHGFFDDEENTSVDPALVKGDFGDVKDFCLRNDINEIYFALPVHKNHVMDRLKKFADQNTIYLRYAPDYHDIIQSNYDVTLWNSIPILTIRSEPLEIPINIMLKRTFDILFSLSVILLVFPWLFLIIAVAIRIESPGPIFFKQLRPGRDNRLFECYKFRTMRVNRDTEKQATKNDPRITRVGAFLRKTSLDEFPQFFNVLKGDMSVVGPRPNMIGQLEDYSRMIKNYGSRHFITPGITGYAQVSGYRGETQELELMEKRVEFDIKYIENWSLLLDIKIVLLTVLNIFKGEKNAY